MKTLSNAVVKFLKAEDGPTAVEYAVMLALIIVVCITAITTLGSNANKTFTSVGTAVGAASETGTTHADWPWPFRSPATWIARVPELE